MGCLWSALLVVGLVTSGSYAAPGADDYSKPFSLLKRDTSADDPATPYWKLDTFKKYAAIGDSYSAGIGAGNRLGSAIGDLLGSQNWACSRYDGSYPYMLNMSLGGSQKFQFESCSGAKIPEIIDQQLPRIDSDQDLITISGGGNDLDFVGILNQCVYQIFAPTQATAVLLAANLKGLGSDDLNKAARSCEDTLKDVTNTANGADFAKSVDNLIQGALKKLSSSGKIYYTGYAKFWAEDMSKGDWCDTHDWSVFLSKVNDKWSFQPPATLTVDRRKAMNTLIDTINGKLADAVKRAGNKVVFVDYDSVIGLVNGRFCAKGVQEPQTKRLDLNFYELDWSDPLGTYPFKRDGGDIYDNTFEYEINHLADLAVQSTITFKGDTTPKGISAPSDSNNKRDMDHPIGKRALNPLPDGYGRIFHPQIVGHGIIANLIKWNMASNVAASEGFTFDDEITAYDQNKQCAIQPTPKPTCDMNKASNIPYNVFPSAYGPFCDTQSKNPKSAVNSYVDSNGKPIKRQRSLDKRTPPPNPDAYKDYIFHLKWDPAGDAASCSKSCKDAWDYISNSPCGHTGGQSNTVASTGTFDLGTSCGKYSWEITAPTTPSPSPTPITPLKEANLQCAGKNTGGDVQKGTLSYNSGFACAGTAYKNLGPNDPGMDYVSKDGSVTYHYHVQWIQGCKTTVDTQNVANPLNIQNPGYTICQDTYIKTYDQCTGNGGAGGTIDEGCLRYSFGIV